MCRCVQANRHPQMTLEYMNCTAYLLTRLLVQFMENGFCVRAIAFIPEFSALRLLFPPHTTNARDSPLPPGSFLFVNILTGRLSFYDP